MKITVDTNVIFQALYSNSGASYQIVKMIREGTLTLVLSIPVYLEYRDVLKRERTLSYIDKSTEDIDIVLEFLALVGEPYDMNYLWRPNLKDENDNIFIELVFASGSEYLITSNIRDFTFGNELLFDSFSIATPSEFLTRWRRKDG